MSFIFQSKPIRYDLRKVLVPGFRVSWVASRYRDFMRPGEVVYLWLAGDPDSKGIYGWGEITGEQPKADDRGIFRIEITYRRNFLEHPSGRHLSLEEIQGEPVLASMLILRFAAGTNFLLSEEEDAAVRRLIKEKYGPDWLPPERSAEGGES